MLGRIQPTHNMGERQTQRAPQTTMGSLRFSPVLARVIFTCAWPVSCVFVVDAPSKVLRVYDDDIFMRMRH